VDLFDLVMHIRMKIPDPHFKTQQVFISEGQHLATIPKSHCKLSLLKYGTVIPMQQKQ
jgi:hypothetical protein